MDRKKGQTDNLWLDWASNPAFLYADEEDQGGEGKYESVPVHRDGRTDAETR